MSRLMQKAAIEAAAIAAYESHVRTLSTMQPHWLALPVAERQRWRFRVVQTMNREVA